jgi:hypothetical protein
MDMRERWIRPSNTVDLFSWLVVAPVATGLILLLLIAPNLPYDVQTDLPEKGPFIVASSLPSLGALSALGYGLTMSRLRPLLYLLPFGVLSLASVVSGVFLAANSQDPELVRKGSPVDVAMWTSAICWLTMPVFALLGGMLAFLNAQRHR